MGAEAGARGAAVPGPADPAASPDAVLLAGPTASGKSDWALALAAQRAVEIVSVDASQVYRGLDIGTAKPDAATRARVPHHLLDIRDPLQRYSAGEFVEDARRLIGEVRARGALPLLVGGTMLYFRALIGGLASLPRADPQLRREIDERAAREGWPALHAQLARVDPQAAARIHPNDPQRIQRALEVQLATGRPISAWQQQSRSAGDDGAGRAAGALRFARWALAPSDRAQLHARIAARTDAMLAAGWLEEVGQLRSRADLHPALPALRAVGYRELWSVLDGQRRLDEARTAIVAATRQLAKRQLTWVRADAGWQKLDPFAVGARAEWLRMAEFSVSPHGRP